MLIQLIQPQSINIHDIKCYFQHTKQIFVVVKALKCAEMHAFKLITFFNGLQHITLKIFVFSSLFLKYKNDAMISLSDS